MSALAVTVGSGDRCAVDDIIKFCKDSRILFHVSASTLSIVNQNNDFEMVKLLIDNFCYYRVRISK